jgi:hypothetical protein
MVYGPVSSLPTARAGYHWLIRLAGWSVTAGTTGRDRGAPALQGFRPAGPCLAPLARHQDADHDAGVAPGCWH